MTLLQRRLGRTGHRSSVAILGGAAFATCTAAEASEGFHAALARGVNHLDVAPRYGGAEALVGPHVPPVRSSLFVADKTTRRNADGVRAQLETSLTRLGTDHIDLYQMHAVTSLDELDSRAAAADAIFGRGTRACAGSSASPGTISTPRPRSSRRWRDTTSTR